MIWNNFATSVFLGKKGSALSVVLLFVVLVNLFSIGLAFYLARLKPDPIIPINTIVSADYQMESVIIMQMQKYRNSGEKPKSFEKDILPGIHMKVDCSEIEKDQWLFQASLNGRGIEKKIKVKSSPEIPDKLIFLE